MEGSFEKVALARIFGVEKIQKLKIEYCIYF